MSIVNLLITIIVVIMVFVIAKNIMAKHPYFGKVILPMGVPQTFILLIALMFALTCIWQLLLEILDEMRTPEFWIGAFSSDQILGDIFQTADEYNVDLDIPKGEYGQDALIMIANVMKSIKMTFLCLILGIIFYAIYIWGLFRKNKPMLYLSIVLLGCIFVVSARASGVGIIHFVNWMTSGIYNPYNGDMSDSIMLPFYTIVALVIAVVGVIKGFIKINCFMESPISVESNMKQIVGYSQSYIGFNNTPEFSSTFTNDNRSKTEKLIDLKKLLDAGILTEEEFFKMKREILNN